MWPANLVWVPRVTAAEIAAGTGQDVRLWAVVDVKSMIDTWAPLAPGVMVNPMTTWGDIIYGGQTPAGVPTRLGAGAAGTFLQSNGVGAAPSWAAVSGGSSKWVLSTIYGAYSTAGYGPLGTNVGIASVLYTTTASTTYISPGSGEPGCPWEIYSSTVLNNTARSCGPSQMVATSGAAANLRYYKWDRWFRLYATGVTTIHNYLFAISNPSAASAVPQNSQFGFRYTPAGGWVWFFQTSGGVLTESALGTTPGTSWMRSEFIVDGAAMTVNLYTRDGALAATKTWATGTADFGYSLNYRDYFAAQTLSGGSFAGIGVTETKLYTGSA